MSLARRLWTYQAERFPLVRTALLVAVFSAASLSVSAHLAGRALPGPGAYAAGFFCALVLFFQMRAADEVKDHDDDCRFRPERPIPRGLVSLRLIVGIALGLAPLAALAAWAVGMVPLVLLLATWGWLALMSLEFGAPAWLRDRMLVYLVSHMAIMPLMDLFLTSLEWAGAGGPHPALALFLALSFVNGCVLEIGRKTWTPENERAGVESYSRLWGPGRAAFAWAGLVAAAGVLLALLGLALSPALAGLFAALGASGALGALALARRFAHAPMPGLQKALDAGSGLWVLVCYGAAGVLPMLIGGGP
ncbi:hypothetical protein Ga0609869_000527 [Rhodovulum iodosum]|uniref:Manganese transporter permease n=1 Tax=Rhodovulum iodosum TaxID=68291 RepID=A0ABV3XQ45_9RHOB|nr:UbiA family prenyltransferase [Rhodovulum robiginosum]RSK31526.1 manganese transporter permease [Rhodovulum robiginosum]